MVEHLPPDRANQPFSVGVLPWRSRCRWSVTNVHRAKPPDVYLAIGTIAITHDIIRRYAPSARPSDRALAAVKPIHGLAAHCRRPAGRLGAPTKCTLSSEDL